MTTDNPEPKQGSEEQCECCGVAHTAESSDEEIESHFDRIFAFLAAKRRSEPIQMVLKSKYDALRAEVERLKKLHSDHCSNPICEGPRS